MNKKLIIPDKSLYSWIGGKKWLSKDIQDVLSKELKDKTVHTYLEPFLGGMGSFKSILKILQDTDIKEIYLNDINPLIIETLKYIQNDFSDIEKHYIQLVQDFINTFPKQKLNTVKFNSKKKKFTKGFYHYSELQKTKDKEVLKELFLVEPQLFFNKVKKEFNSDKLANNITVHTISKFLFLMTYCFNGVYRENQKGEFNVPFNWGNKPEIGLNKVKEFEMYHDLFNNTNVTFENMDVFDFLDKYQNKPNTLVYLDPPYANDNGGENKYSKDSFDKKAQLKLLTYTKKFSYILYSNHNIDYILNFFNSPNDNIKSIFRKNIMSANAANRKEDKQEILIFRNNLKN